MIAALYPNIWAPDGMLQAETLAMFARCVAMLLAYRYWRATELARLVLVGAVCGARRADPFRADPVLVPLVVVPLACARASAVARAAAVARRRGARRGDRHRAVDDLQRDALRAPDPA